MTSMSSPESIAWVVERLGENPRRTGFAYPPGPREQVGMADPPGFDRVGQRPADVFLADQFFEIAGTITSRDNDIRGIGCGCGMVVGHS